MRTRILILALVGLAALGIVSHMQAIGAPKPILSVPSVLSQAYLKGGMQGQSGITLDLNGDGLEDLVIGSPNGSVLGSTGCLLIHMGHRRGFSGWPSMLLKGDGNLGWSLVGLGDVNKDGKEDFAAGASNGSGEGSSLSGIVNVYQGGWIPRKLSVLEGENAMDKFGYALASGDLNGDGFLDIIVGAPYHSPSPELYQQGGVYVFFGPNYDSATALKIPATPVNLGIGFSLATGDVNGDRVDDLLMGATGKITVFYGVQGSFAPSPAVPDVVITSTESGFGRSLAVLWDLDGDGFRDIAVGAAQGTVSNVLESGKILILKGGPGKRTVNADTVSADLLTKIEGEANCGRFGSSILPVGDIDGDNVPDLVVSAVHADGSWPMTGKIFLFSGKTLASCTNVALAKAVNGESKDMHLGNFLAIAGRGGKLVAGAPTQNGNTGAVWVFNLR